MDHLIFITSLSLLAYYFMVYLPSNPLPNKESGLRSQKPTLSPSPLTNTKNTQTEPIPETNTNQAQTQLEQLLEDNKVKEKTIQELNQSKNTEIKILHQKNEDSAKQISELKKQITSLQTQIRDLAKRPVQPTNHKSVQTDQLSQTLDALIKNIQELNNSL